MNRRLAAVGVSFLLLNLNVIGADRACGPRHDVAPASQEQAGHEHHVPAPTQQHEAPAKCCDAISSCGMTLSLGGEVVLTHDALDAAVVSRLAFNSPGSVPRAPEPPPPKA